MVKKKILALATVAAVLVLAFALVGCGGGSYRNATKAVPASEAFNQQGVWFNKSNDSIAKDSKPSHIFVFDGKGNVTTYTNETVTFGDLNKLSNDDIIKLAQQADQDFFNTKQQAAIDQVQKNIDSAQELCDQLVSERDSGDFTTFKKFGITKYSNYYEIAQDPAKIKTVYDDAISVVQDAMAGLNAGKEWNEAAEYTAPDPQAFTLTIKTDNSGNNTASESLAFSFRDAYAGFYGSTGKSIAATNNMSLILQNSLEVMYASQSNATSGANKRIQLVTYTTPESIYQYSNANADLSPTYSVVVYDTYFNGYKDMTTVVDKNMAGFTLDKPGTKGVEEK